MRSTALFSSYLLLLIACSYRVQGSRLIYHNEAGQPNELDMMELFIGEPPRPPSLAKRSELLSEKDRDKQQASGLWFGPRLGRRRRAADGSASRIRRSIEDGLTGKTVYLGQDGPWTVMTFGGGKRDVNFSPRLGRSEEEMLMNFLDPEFASYRNPGHSDGGQSGSSDGHNFTPRLGRLAPITALEGH